ncbi:Protein dispatched 1 [Homalodisca vitripennis]|nr:Protein dispatched 1 [Homalodisca vitripennis]
MRPNRSATILISKTKENFANRITNSISTTNLNDLSSSVDAHYHKPNNITVVVVDDGLHNHSNQASKNAWQELLHLKHSTEDDDEEDIFDELEEHFHDDHDHLSEDGYFCGSGPVAHPSLPPHSIVKYILPVCSSTHLPPLSIYSPLPPFPSLEMRVLQVCTLHHCWSSIVFEQVVGLRVNSTITTRAKEIATDRVGEQVKDITFLSYSHNCERALTRKSRLLLGLEFSRVVVSMEGSGDLMSLTALKDMCRLEQYLTSGPLYADVCENVRRGQCCQPWSLPNYVAMLHNRSSCFDIIEADVSDTRELIENCSHFYYSLHLMPDIVNKEVPHVCRKYNAIYNLMHYILDVSFMPPKVNESTPLKNTVIFLPMARSTAILDYYHALEAKKLRVGNVYISAIDFEQRFPNWGARPPGGAWRKSRGGVTPK